MSLHIGNLSPRIRKNELEHVFRRFGRCTMQLKDGFGFAVYDFCGDAENALRCLKGRKICGESVHLSWSKNQPKPLQRFARAARSPDMPYRGNSGRGDNFVGRNNLRSHRDYSTSDKRQPDNGRERPKSSEIHHDRPDYNLKDARHVRYDQRDVVLETGGPFDVEPNPLDNGRWEERADNLRNGADVNGLTGFDRYKPDFGAEKGEKYENHGSEYLADPHSVGTLPEKRRVHPEKKRGQQSEQTCFKCGFAGHKIRDCRWGEDMQKKSTCNSNYSYETKGKSIGRADLDSRPRGWLQSSSKDSRPRTILDTDRKLSYSGEGGVGSRSVPMTVESGRNMSNDCSRKRQREMNDHIVEIHDDKKARVLDLSHLHSDYTSTELGTHSRPRKPSVGFRSHSRSVSSRSLPKSHRSKSLSRSPRSRSLSKSHRSKSLSRSPRSRSRTLKVKSRSRSRSRSPSSSLSISLGRSSPSSPVKAEVNLNGFPEGTPNPHPKEVLTEDTEHLELEGREENRCIANRVQTSLNGFMDNTDYQLTEVLIERKLSEHDLDTQTSTKNAEVSFDGYVEERKPYECNSDTQTSTKNAKVSLDGSTEDEKIAQHQEVVDEERQFLEVKTMQDFEPQDSTKNEEVSLDGSTEDEKIAQYQEVVDEERQFLEVEMMQDYEPQRTDAPLVVEDVSFSGSLIHGTKLDQLPDGSGSDSTAPNVSSGIEAHCSSWLEKDDKESAAAKLASEKLREIAEIKSGKESVAANCAIEKLGEIAETEYSNTFEMTKPLEPTNKSDLIAPSTIHVGSHLNISAEELYRVLKHYGLKHPEENIQLHDVGDYFGSSRLWPWEMIYYRRLKKGPISIENYARRVAQNKAFNITDKFIRSSSGWGEYIEEQI